VNAPAAAASLAISLILGCLPVRVSALEPSQALPAAESEASLLLLREDAASSPAGLLDRLLGVNASTSRMQRPVSSGRTAFEALSLAPAQPGLALLCNRGSVGALGFTRQCLLARLEVDAGHLPGYGSGAGLSGAWFIEQAGVDLSFGLSWLSVEQPQRLAGSSSRLIGLPELMDLTPLQLNLPAADRQAGALQIGARLDLGQQGWLRIDAQALRSRGQVIDLWGTSVPVIDSDALRLSLGSGAFSGAMTGRVIELQGLPGVVNSLDLGVSWRTPWRGELSVGTTQYWSRGDTSTWPLRELPPAAEESSGRVPYVRYHQDL